MDKSEFKNTIKQDLRRYTIDKPLTLRVFLKCFYVLNIPGLKFTIIHRYCQYYRRKNRFLFYFFMLWLRHLKVKYGFDISYRTTIGKGFYIGHFGGIVINGDAVIGENCNLSQGVTIGVLVRGNKTGIPKIGDRVFIGPGATILGGITIGNDVLIGANAIVTFDVPDNAVVASPLATIISYEKGSEGYISSI
jgi:serine O-acetyltransferase